MPPPNFPSLNTAERTVLPAVYGYWSACTSSPRACARSINCSDSRTRPHADRPEALWCEICTGTPARSPISIASRTESSRPVLSSRMWVAYSPPVPRISVASSTSSSVSANRPGS